jgi:hypothetical protein
MWLWCSLHIHSRSNSLTTFVSCTTNVNETIILVNCISVSTIFIQKNHSLFSFSPLLIVDFWLLACWRIAGRKKVYGDFLQKSTEIMYRRHTCFCFVLRYESVFWRKNECPESWIDTRPTKKESRVESFNPAKKDVFTLKNSRMTAKWPPCRRSTKPYVWIKFAACDANVTKRRKFDGVCVFKFASFRNICGANLKTPSQICMCGHTNWEAALRANFAS